MAQHLLKAITGTGVRKSREAQCCADGKRVWWAFRLKAWRNIVDGAGLWCEGRRIIGCHGSLKVTMPKADSHSTAPQILSNPAGWPLSLNLLGCVDGGYRVEGIWAFSNLLSVRLRTKTIQAICYLLPWYVLQLCAMICCYVMT